MHMPDEPNNNLRQILLLSPLSTSTVTKTLTLKYDIEGSQEEIKNISDTLTELVDKIIIPILKTNINNIENKFNELRPIIASWLNKAITMVVQSQLSEEEKDLTRNDFNKIAKLNFESFEELKHFVQLSSLGSDIRTKIVQIIDNLSDYENVLLGIAIERPEELELALKQIDIDDLKKNLLNALLAFFSILYIIRVEEKEYDKEKLSKLVSLAKEYSEEIESYVDTIDILSNPKTMESIRKSEEYYNLTND
jgi:hypothetical protein